MEVGVAAEVGLDGGVAEEAVAYVVGDEEGDVEAGVGEELGELEHGVHWALKGKREEEDVRRRWSLVVH